MQEYKKTNVKAIFSLVLSILSVLCCCIWFFSLMLGVASVVLGILSLRSENPNQQDAAIAGIVVGSVGFALSVTVAIMRIVVLSGITDAAVTAALELRQLI